MTALSLVERKAIFTLTRILTLLVILLLSLGIVFGLYNLFVGTTQIPSSRVKAEDVFKESTAPSPRKGSKPADLDPLKGLKLPENPTFKEWMNDSNVKGIIEQQVGLVDPEDRQYFMDEFGKVITKVEGDKSKIVSSVKKFFDLAATARKEKAEAEAERKSEREKAFYGVGMSLGLFALFSLVLVMLAIERNTRTTA